jgi:hypothetical protein
MTDTLKPEARLKYLLQLLTGTYTMIALHTHYRTWPHVLELQVRPFTVVRVSEHPHLLFVTPLEPCPTLVTLTRLSARANLLIRFEKCEVHAR